MKRKAIIIAGLILLLVSPSLFGKSSILVFVIDMYDQRSIKPQEPGSMLDFPIHSISTDGRVYEPTSKQTSPNWFGKEMNAATATKNPHPATPESLANGKLQFDTYCAVCHGDGKTMNDLGMAKSKVNEKGMIAPAILFMTPGFTDGYLYNKIKYASGAIMPPLGYATTAKERWDIVNYIRTLENQ